MRIFDSCEYQNGDLWRRITVRLFLVRVFFVISERRSSMKILHTADWHIGRTLYGKKRYEEFEAFLVWLAETIEQNGIAVLLVAGDIFDTSTPSNRAQQLYYRFLCRVADSPCRHVVVIAGNHDSPSFLNAPKELLKALDVHVVANAATSLDDEVLVLRDGSGDPELIVCAVPYLRDRDIRVAEAGESIEDKGRKLIDGIRSHYEQVAAIAEGKRQQLENDIPIVAMGHLFTAGGRTIDGDGVRELYVGSLAYVTAAVFSDSFDYVALGHLHVPQTVGGSETIRYSGSPVPMGFGESNQRKSVCQVEFRGTVASVQMHDIPVFQHLECIKGNWDSISSRIRELSEMDFKGWVEIIYNGEHIVGNLRERLETAIVDTQIEILRIKNNRIVDSFIGQIREEETLDNLHANDVFERCLNVNEVPVDQRPELLQSYKEIVSFLYEDDVQAE